jgi:predicted nucleic-acid-binding protein
MVYLNTTIQYINTLINIEYVYYIQHGEVIPYRNTTIQYINTLINIEYVYYIQHGEVIHTEIQLYCCM